MVDGGARLRLMETSTTQNMRPFRLAASADDEPRATSDTVPVGRCDTEVIERSKSLGDAPHPAERYSVSGTPLAVGCPGVQAEEGASGDSEASDGRAVPNQEDPRSSLFGAADASDSWGCSEYQYRRSGYRRAGGSKQRSSSVPVCGAVCDHSRSRAREGVGPESSAPDRGPRRRDLSVELQGRRSDATSGLDDDVSDGGGDRDGDAPRRRRGKRGTRGSRTTRGKETAETRARKRRRRREREAWTGATAGECDAGDEPAADATLNQ